MGAANHQSSVSFTRKLYHYQSEYYQETVKKGTVAGLVEANLAGRVFTLAVSFILHAEAVYRAIAVCFLTIKEIFSKSSEELLAEHKKECKIAYTESMQSLADVFYRTAPRHVARARPAAAHQKLEREGLGVLSKRRNSKRDLLEAKHEDGQRSRRPSNSSQENDSLASAAGAKRVSNLREIGLGGAAASSAANSPLSLRSDEFAHVADPVDEVRSIRSGNGLEEEEKQSEPPLLSGKTSPVLVSTAPQSPLSIQIRNLEPISPEVVGSPKSPGVQSLPSQSEEIAKMGAAESRSPGMSSRSSEFEHVQQEAIEQKAQGSPRSPGMSSVSSGFEDLANEPLPPRISSPLRIDPLGAIQGGASEKPASPYLKLFDDDQPGLANKEPAGARPVSLDAKIFFSTDKERLREETVQAERVVAPAHAIRGVLRQSTKNAAALLSVGDRGIGYFKAPPMNFHDPKWKFAQNSVWRNSVGICQFIGQGNALVAQHLATSLEVEAQGTTVFVPLFGVFEPQLGPHAAKCLVDHLPRFLKAHLNHFSEKGFSEDRIWNAISLAFLNLNEEFIRLNQGLKENSKPIADQGASATVALIIQDHLWIAQLGNTRAAMDDGRNLIQLTEDPHPQKPGYKELVMKLGGAIDQNGLVNGKLNMATAFGHAYLNGAVSGKPVITKHLIAALPPRSHMILGTCSLFSATSTKQICEWLREQKYRPVLEIAHDIVNSIYIANQTSKDPQVKNRPISSLVVGINERTDLFLG